MNRTPSFDPWAVEIGLRSLEVFLGPELIVQHLWRILDRRSSNPS